MARIDSGYETFAVADATMGTRDSRKVGHNTYAIRRGPDAIAIRYYATDIMSIRRDGWLVIDPDGWRSATTMQRLGTIVPAPWRIGSDHGRTFLYSGGWRIMPFVDGMAVRRADDSCPDAVGMPGEDGTVAPLLTWDDIAAIRADAEAASIARAAKRAERIAREHAAYRNGRYHPQSRRPQGRSWDCPACRALDAADDAANRERARLEHVAASAALAAYGADPAAWPDDARAATGAHLEVRQSAEWPVDPATGRTDYSGRPTFRTVHGLRCMYPCPLGHASNRFVPVDVD